VVARIGLVLGAGGVTGGAFHAGALAALEEATGWDPRDAEVVVGTSAGSVLAASLRAGLSASDMAARAEGRPLSAEGRQVLQAVEGTPPSTPRPPPESFRWGPPASPGVLLGAARAPWAVRPTSLVAGLLPEGQISTADISANVEALLGDRWPSRPMWITAVDLANGRLTVFGRNGAPAAEPGPAVAASCAIPGFFAPVIIGGRRYVDGGAHSLTNAAQLAGTGLDLVVVSSPMSQSPAPTGGYRAAGGRVWYLPVLRQVARGQLAVEALALRARGIPVLGLQPTVADQLAMGANPMSWRKRATVARQVRESTLARLQRSRRPELAVLRKA
jgi:NTE family protein